MVKIGVSRNLNESYKSCVRRAWACVQKDILHLINKFPKDFMLKYSFYINIARSLKMSDYAISDFVKTTEFLSHYPDLNFWISMLKQFKQFLYKR
jgi:hypothetical protein